MGISNLYSKDAVTLSIKMPNSPEYKKISVKEEFAQEIENFIYQYPSLGYRSIAQFLEDSARRRLEELKAKTPPLPRFLQINSDENGIKIYDNYVKERNKEVDVYFRPNGIRCSKHHSSDCEHVIFALSIPEVKQILEKHIREDGWKLELPEV